MNRKLIVAAVSAALIGGFGLASVASAQTESTLYGSLRAGIVSGDDDINGSRLDLGGTGNDGTNIFFNRFGIRGSSDLGNGASAGFEMEVGLDSNLNTRLANVWIDGTWGRLTLGQQSNPYHSARKWDQAIYLGDAYSASVGSRIEGVQYSSNFDGPFSFSVMANANDTGTANDDVDAWTFTAGYDFGPFKLDVSRQTNEIDNSLPLETTAIGINGSVGPFTWVLAYQDANDTDAGGNDTDSIGGFVGFNLSAANLIYAEHVNHSGNGANAFANIALGSDPTETILGYSHTFGGGVSFVAEYRSLDMDTNMAGGKPTLLALALEVDF